MCKKNYDFNRQTISLDNIEAIFDDDIAERSKK